MYTLLKTINEAAKVIEGKSVSKPAAASVYHRDYVKTRNKSYRKRHSNSAKKD